MIQLAQPDITTKEVTMAASVLYSGQLTNGKVVKELEKKISEKVGFTDVVCLDSCTAALELALRALGVGPADEVITTPYTYTATADVIHNVGAKIVFCDIAESGFEMDYDKLPKLVTSKTKAIIPVDIGGVPCNLSKMKNALGGTNYSYISQTVKGKRISGIPIILDAAHTFGATSYGDKAGGLADFVCFSFHAVKTITTGGEGGALCWNTSDWEDTKELNRYVRLMADHGQTERETTINFERDWEYDVELIGQNHIMTNVDAAIGLAQLERFGEMIEKRAMLVSAYMEKLPASVESSLSHFSCSYQSSYHLFLITIPDATEEERNRIFGKLKSEGVNCSVHFKPLPMFTAYQNLGFTIDDYPNAYNRYKTQITLPLHTNMTKLDVIAICKILKEVTG